MKTISALIITILCSIGLMAQGPLKIQDFKMLDGTHWTGVLTYKDYQSGELKNVETEMQIELKGDKIITKIQYPKEPKKNNTSSVKLKQNGLYYGNEKVISNTNDNGVQTFITTYEGRDNNQKATMYITHEFGEKSFKITKEVQYEGSNERFVRNTYQFTKQ